MSWNKKIKAFTILEIVIALAIMSIIVAITYSIYTMLSGNLIGFSKNTEATNSYNELDTRLQYDFFNAKAFEYKNESLLLTGSNDSVIYIFNENQFIRKSRQRLDTFNIKITEFKPISKKVTKEKGHKGIVVTYDLLGVPITATYFKNFGCVETINTFFHEH